MKHSLVAEAFLANLKDSDRVVALAEAEKYLTYKHDDLAVLAGVQMAQILCMLEEFELSINKLSESTNKVVEFNRQFKEMRSIRNEIIESSIAYAIALVDKKSRQKKLYSEAGIQGARLKNKKTNALKVWAIESARKLHGDDKANAKALFMLIPDELREASVNPERLIYETLLAARREDKLKRQAGRT